MSRVQTDNQLGAFSVLAVIPDDVAARTVLKNSVYDYCVFFKFVSSR